MNDSAAEPSEALPATGLSFALSRLGHHAAAAFTARLAPTGLTPRHVAVLRLVVPRPGVYTQAALADRLGVLPSRLVVLLDELGEAGWIERQPDAADRRRNLLHPTEEGARRFTEVVAAADALDAELAAPLTATERAELARLLGLVAAAAPGL